MNNKSFTKPATLTPEQHIMLCAIADTKEMDEKDSSLYKKELRIWSYLKPFIKDEFKTPYYLDDPANGRRYDWYKNQLRDLEAMGLITLTVIEKDSLAATITPLGEEYAE
jgi:hypothetical protein